MMMKVFILLVLLHLVWNHENSHTALRFGKDARSYIYYMGTVDLSAMEKAFSVCSWVRRMSHHHSNRQDWVSYVGTTHSTGEIVISDSSDSWLLGDETSYNQPTLTVGNWSHMCHTFSYSTRTKRVFYNGEQIGKETTSPGRKLDRTGSLMFGNYLHGDGRPDNGNYFGGELYDTNFFSIELSDEQIRHFYNEGRCSNYSKTSLANNTVLSWEDILSHQRTGKWKCYGS